MVPFQPARRAAARRRRSQATTDTRDRRAFHVQPLILLVDDQEDQRELYREYLHFAGYQTDVASSGFEAIQKALARKPDVIVMDLSMPALDGFETTRRLKSLQLTRDIPIIALTAHGELLREWAMDAGCTSYLVKPALPAQLEAELEAVLEGPST